MSNLQKDLLRSKLPPRPICTQKKVGGRQKKDYTALNSTAYFEEYQDVKVAECSFRVYMSATPPVVNYPLLVLLHGGGFNGLSWACFSKEITAIAHCKTLAIDCRGHGDTHTDNEELLAYDTLAHDVANVIKALYPEAAPNIILVGHSLGGAIGIHCSNMKLIPSLVGLCVIDVVEGTAMDSLQSMQSFLRSRPSSFKSTSEAIEWCIRSGQIRNVESARVSMPGQIINCGTNKLATNELPCNQPKVVEASSLANPNCIPEDEEENIKTTTDFSAPNNKYIWRVDLTKSEIYWHDWFKGLSETFLSLSVPKLLLLAGIDNLDKALTVGQMQGKFQLQVLAKTGHVVHEDRPHEVAEVIASYLIRNRFAEAAGEFFRQMPAC